MRFEQQAVWRPPGGTWVYFFTLLQSSNKSLSPNGQVSFFLGNWESAFFSTRGYRLIDMQIPFLLLFDFISERFTSFYSLPLCFSWCYSSLCSDDRLREGAINHYGPLAQYCNVIVCLETPSTHFTRELYCTEARVRHLQEDYATNMCHSELLARRRRCYPRPWSI